MRMTLKVIKHLLIMDIYLGYLRNENSMRKILQGLPDMKTGDLWD